MLYSFFEKNSKSKNKKLFVVLLILTLVSIFIMQHFDSQLKTTTSPKGIISFEFAKNIDESIKIIDVWKEKDVLKAADSNLKYDFVFAFTYITFISLLLFLVTNKRKKSIKIIGKTLVWAMLFVAFLEIIENISLLQLLAGNIKQTWATIAYYAAIPKFSITFLSIFYVLVNATLFGFRKARGIVS
jgi:hypothetical protein